MKYRTLLLGGVLVVVVVALAGRWLWPDGSVQPEPEVTAFWVEYGREFREDGLAIVAVGDGVIGEIAACSRGALTERCPEAARILREQATELRSFVGAFAGVVAPEGPARRWLETQSGAWLELAEVWEQFASMGDADSSYSVAGYEAARERQRGIEELVTAEHLLLDVLFRVEPEARVLPAAAGD